MTMMMMMLVVGDDHDYKDDDYDADYYDDDYDDADFYDADYYNGDYYNGDDGDYNPTSALYSAGFFTRHTLHHPYITFGGSPA